MSNSPDNSDESTGTLDAPIIPDLRKWYQKLDRNHGVVAILFLVNLLNYIDRYTIAGVLDDIGNFYDLNSSEQGLLQTTFILSYMILAPIFGYLGDRYSRKWLLCVGITFWSITTLAGSFVPQDQKGWFFFIRALVGVGEASYSTIAPTIISDLYTNKMRSRMLGLFYFAIPVGSGLGYIVGSSVAAAAGSWEWSLRVTPPLGVLSVVLIACCLRDPPRGKAEGGHHIQATSWWTDVKCLLVNPSFITSTLGFAAVAFVAGALSLWAPQFMMYSLRLHYNDPTYGQASISFKFGVITCIAGIAGVGLGSYLSQRLRSKSVEADPIICAAGMIITAPLVYFSILAAKSYPDLSWALVFFAEVFLCLNWPIVGDITLYVVVPPRRSSASAFNILMSHTLGDAISPYIVGAVADAIKTSYPNAEDTWNEWNALRDGLFVTTFISVLGGLFFIMCSWYVVADKEKVDETIKGANRNETVDNGGPLDDAVAARIAAGGEFFSS